MSGNNVHKLGKKKKKNFFKMVCFKNIYQNGIVYKEFLKWYSFPPSRRIHIYINIQLVEIKKKFLIDHTIYND